MRVTNSRGLDIEFSSPVDAASYCIEHEEIYPFDLKSTWEEYEIFKAHYYEADRK